MKGIILVQHVQLQINSASLPAVPQLNEGSCDEFLHFKPRSVDPFIHFEIHVALERMGTWQKMRERKIIKHKNFSTSKYLVSEITNI